MSRTPLNRLFVYGSLKPGGTHVHHLDGLGGSWCSAEIRGRFFDDNWIAGTGYPAVILDDDASPIRGYLLESAKLSERWARLDAFEGTAYRRVVARVTRDDGTQTEAWVYVSSKA